MQQGELFRNRKFLILAGLLLLLVIVNVIEWRQSAKSASQQQKTPSGKQMGIEGDPVLQADKLSEEKMEFQQEKRNIFTFSGRSESAVSEAEMAESEQPPPPPEPVCGNGACEDGEDPTNCPSDCQPPPPPAPVITLRYIGYLSEPDGSVAFLTDGKEVFMGRVNDVIANQYRVLKITEDNVELGFLNNNQSSTIRFQGNQGG